MTNITSHLYVKIHTEYIDEYKTLVKNLIAANEAQQKALQAIEDFLVENTKPKTDIGEQDDN